MPQKILFIIIGALVGLLFFILAIVLGTNTVGVQVGAFIELVLVVGLEVLFHKRFAKNETVRNINRGILYGSIVYFALMILAKTFVFSLLGSLTN